MEEISRLFSLLKLIKFPITAAKAEDLRRRMAALPLAEADLVETYFKTVRSGGKAGLVGVMIFHPASGLRIRCRRERSQGINRFLARRMLVEELEKRARREDEAGREAKAMPALPPQHLSLPLPPAHWALGSGAGVIELAEPAG